MSDGEPEDDDLDEAGDDAEPKPDEATTKRGLKRQERRAERDLREATEFWRGVFSSPVGRREMWRVLEASRVNEDAFACGPNGFPQPEATWFQAGQAALGRRLLDSWQVMDFLGVYRMRREYDPRFRRAPEVADDAADGVQ